MCLESENLVSFFVFLEPHALCVYKHKSCGRDRHRLSHMMCVGKGFELKKSRANERNESLVGFLKHLGTSYGGQVQLEIDEFLGGLEVCHLHMLCFTYSRLDSRDIE
jgi:hypothetical protein